MKRIIFLLLVTVITILSMNVEAADLPDFGDIDQDNLVFRGTQLDNSYDIEVYLWYDVDSNENFAERYVNFLVNNYPFKYLGHYVKNANHSNNVSETWFFYYVGSKNVPSFTKKVDRNAAPYDCHVTLKRFRNYRSGHTEFTIRVAHGLEYPRHAPQSSPTDDNDKENCPSCGGSGICRECGGSGRVTKWGGDRDYHNLTCTACAGMGKCRYCRGTGKV